MSSGNHSASAETLAITRTLPGLVVSVLVPNLKGALRAIDSGAHSMLLPLSPGWRC